MLPRPRCLLRVLHICVSLLVLFCAFSQAQEALDQPGMVLPRIVQPVGRKRAHGVEGEHSSAGSFAI